MAIDEMEHVIRADVLKRIVREVAVALSSAYHVG
jgi:hypothetical protein